jgi:myosin-5
MDDSGPYEIAEPRVITALETYTPSCTSTLIPTHPQPAQSFLTPKLMCQ